MSDPHIAADARYYQEIQAAFVARRGAPLTLSSADWTLARKWRRGGIPLRIVLRGIADAMQGHAESWQRDRRIYHLRFCTPAIAAAQRRWHEALSASGQGHRPLSDHLGRLVEELGAASGLPATLSRERDRIARALGERIDDPGSAAELDRWLQTCERRLTRVARAALPPKDVEVLERAVDADLAPYRERMPVQVVEDVRDESLTREFLARFALPRLSLFHGE